ncbi:hypothetical protein BJ322DRAFT_745950 [Thelephora terrestris]|uniref:Uncharacterized protein n=1 Tax=Thelephora terrestris TaxID=56493 RepID=A0A9P6L7C3_9AGAM|nr:hypothetical protein BJ322DRAFT_745950 [Thelephora terrestris]
MADFVQALDHSKLVFFGTVLSAIVSPFSSPTYNLPIYLFGTLVQEIPDAPQSLRLFIALLGGSVIMDIIWLAGNSQGAFTRMITIIILIFKVPTWLAFANSLRQAGGSFAGLNIGSRDLGGATVWSMPGGFTSTAGGYQTVDEPATPQNVSRPPAPAPAPTPTQSQPQSGTYQSV